MLNTTQLAAANNASVENLFGFAGQALQGIEQLAALNLQAMKTSLAEFEEISRAALSVTNPAELVTLQTAALQALPQKALAYGAQLKDIFAAMTAGQQTAVQEQVAKMQAGFLDAVDGALKNAPGSENTVALARSAMAAMNNAYEGVNKASKQVSDAFANATNVTQTASSSSRNSRRAVDA